MYVTSSCRSGADLYRLTIRIKESADRPAGENPARSAASAAGCLPTLLAPLGVDVIRVDPVDLPSDADQSSAKTAVVLIDLRVPIDLPAIDHLLGVSGHRVLDLRPAAKARLLR